jgi:hypothetical protein
VLGWLAAGGAAAHDWGLAVQHKPASLRSCVDASGPVAVTVINSESIEVQRMAKKENLRADQARDIALYRYSLIRPLADKGEVCLTL